MREPTFWILTALASEPKHGYAILASVEKLSNGSVKLKVPTLYAALDRLERESLISLHHEESVDGRLRRYFELSTEGRTALKDEISRMQDFAARASFQLGTSTTKSIA